MPEQETIERARKDEREGKSPSTQAGEFVREEMEHIREGKHGARSAKQAIAIGLSKARRAGVKLPPPKRGSARTKKQAARDSRKAGRGVNRRGRVRVPCRKRLSANREGLHRTGRYRGRHVRPHGSAPKRVVPEPPEKPRGRASETVKPASYFAPVTRTISFALPRSRTGRPWFEYRRDRKYPALFSGAPTSVPQNRSNRASN